MGVLVQTNFGGVLQIDGAPVGVELGKYYLMDALEKDTARRLSGDLNNAADGSIIIVIATDAPVDASNLRRMAARSMMGLARTGAAGTNGSGDYAIAFSAAPELRIKTLNSNEPRKANLLSNDAMSPLFLATIEATEEAIYNSLFRAASVTGRDKRTIEALPLERTRTILRKYNKIK